MKSDTIELIALIAGIILFFVARKIFQEDVKLGPPSLLAACVAGLAYQGLIQDGQEIITTILIPYEALAVVLFLLFLLFLFYRFTGIAAAKSKDRKRTSSTNRVKTPNNQVESQQDDGPQDPNQDY